MKPTSDADTPSWRLSDRLFIAVGCGFGRFGTVLIYLDTTNLVGCSPNSHSRVSRTDSDDTSPAGLRPIIPRHLGNSMTPPLAA